jgi:hypothetical protein
MEIKMSNKVVIQQQTVNVRNSGHTFKEVTVFDNYESGSIYLEEYSDDFYDDDLELLTFVLDAVKENASKEVKSVIEAVSEYEIGIEIEGTFYEWEIIKHIFDKAETNNPNITKAL